MISAAELACPDLVICPFLTARVPKEIYNEYLTLIVHPGPPGDAGPSALDWVLLGDDGSIDDASELLESLESEPLRPGRSHWGITILQAIEEFDAGPVWAFEQFPIDIDQAGLTKSELYRGPVSRAAISATLAAIDRIQVALDLAGVRAHSPNASTSVNRSSAAIGKVSPHLIANPLYKIQSVETGEGFLGGRTVHRPLLKAAQRDFDVRRHTAQQISRRIRCGDSQPGVLSKLFGSNLYLYGGIIDDCPEGPNPGAVPGAASGTIVGIRNEAVCIKTIDDKGIWITHVRRPKKAKDTALWPKVPAVSGLLELGVLHKSDLLRLQWDLPNDYSKSPYSTFQEIWIDFIHYGEKKAAYLYFDFYNGAMATNQCTQLVDALDYILTCNSEYDPIGAVVLMGGQYFSNGIALNVIEASPSPSMESWLNINRIDDVVYYLLHEFSSRNILTIAGIRGNAAAGGCALATACDLVIAGSEVVLNPAYRAVGLYGSEYHSISYPGRCGTRKANEILRSMTPMSPFEARSIGLVDHVFPGTNGVLDKRIRNHVAVVVKSGKPGRVIWKSRNPINSLLIAQARAYELGEMSKDFWSARSRRYNSRRYNFVRKVKATHTPYRFATHRRLDSNTADDEELPSFDDVAFHEEQLERDILEKHRISSLPTSLDSQRSAPPKPLDKTWLGPPPTTEWHGETVFSCYYAPPSPADSVLLSSHA